MEKDIIHTLNYEERVTSSYAEIYFDNNYCGYQKDIQENLNATSNVSDQNIDAGNWESPSDLLIGKVELKPPFTSKITRGKTHEGILAIGDTVLEAERTIFLESLNNLIQENDSAWLYFLEHERKLIRSKVKSKYDSIFLDKSKIMSKEISKFYESTLQDLEDYMKSEMQTVLISAHSNIISDFNIKIKSNLEKERQILELILQQRYESEVQKVKEYYRLLLRNEMYRNNKLVNKAMHERNDLLNAYLRQIEAENVTSVMYVMSTERKKCKINQLTLEYYHTMERAEKIEKVKERQDIIDDLKSREKCIFQLKYEWEENVKKILKLFLKFITFSLKLLPDQSTFLLDFERMVILQLNEVQKSPTACSILKEESEDNIFIFEKAKLTEETCDKDPLVIMGDLSDIPIPVFGSRETLPSNVDLPFVRLERQFVYAKCHKFEEVKAFFEAQRCKCSDLLHTKQFPEYEIISVETIEQKESSQLQQESESYKQSMRIDDFRRLQECPVRRCKDWSKNLSFPDLNSYLDFTEENFERVKVIIGEPQKKDITTKLVCAKDIVSRDIPFAATKELYRHVETQCSSQEDLNVPIIECPCIDNIRVSATSAESDHDMKEEPTELMNQILMRRRKSLQMLINKNPRLLKMFTDECFDFQL